MQLKCSHMPLDEAPRSSDQRWERAHVRQRRNNMVWMEIKETESEFDDHVSWEPCILAYPFNRGWMAGVAH